MASRPGITPAATICERLRTAVTVRLNVAAAEQWTGVRICSADRERVATRPGVGVVARVDLDPKAVLVVTFEVAHAGYALGHVDDHSSMNGCTRAVVLQRQVSALARGTTGPGDETERRLTACVSRDPPAAADPVLARGPAGRTVDLGFGGPER